MINEYRYAGADGQRIPDLPEGTGAAVGSEYCVHLLPGLEDLRQTISAAKKRGIPLLLLTPYFHGFELKKAMGLFRSIPGEADVEIALNDWGALLSLHALFPRLRLSLGRLLSGQKRCPRIEASARLTREGRAWHGEGIFSSVRARAFLRDEYGVLGYHMDDLPWSQGRTARMPRIDGGTEPFFCVHVPHSIVTVSDCCPWIGGISSSAVSCCARPCRNGSVILREPSTGREMTQRGKARFVTDLRPRTPGPPPTSFDRMVLYEEIP